MNFVPLSSLFPEWKGSVVPEAHEQLRQALLRQELRLRDARFLVAGLITELDYDGQRRSVVGVLPHGSLAEADTSAKVLMERARDQVPEWKKPRWRDYHPEPDDSVPAHLYGTFSSESANDGIWIQVWLFTCSSSTSPLLQLLEAWLPYEDEVRGWLYRVPLGA